MRSWLCVMMLAIMGLSLPPALLAGPQQRGGMSVIEITAGQVKRHIESGQPVVIVDTRTYKEYAEGHLPKAISIPPDQFADMGVFLPADRDIPVITYCRGYS